MLDPIAKLLEQRFKTAFDQLGFAPELPVMVRESSRKEFGDYQVNGVIAIAKKLKSNPEELAKKVIQAVDPKGVIAKLEAAGPGFINITLSHEYLNQALTPELLHIRPVYLHTIVVDYSSPNLAKEMHVGHLRSTIIGDALVRLYEFLGHTVVRRNHIGDWGTQFGMLIAYLVEIDHAKSGLGLALDDLEGFYRRAKIRFDEDQEFADRSREYVVKLQAGDPGALALWQKFVTVSLNHCQKIYDRLGTRLTSADAVGESAYNKLLPQVVQELVAQGVAVESDGAKCVFFTQEELGEQEETPFIIQKKDGAYLYSTTDIAAVYDRVKNLHADYLIYVIDVRQSLHLKQLFATVKKARIATPENVMKHVAFGMMLEGDGKPFKTRSGGTIKLTALIDEAITRAANLVRSRNPDWSQEEVNKLANVLGVASIKYADLAKNRLGDYLFSFDKMLAFEGNTAPYMLYAYVRINSIFNKASFTIANYLNQPITITEVEERNLAIHLIRFPDRLLQAADENYPHYISSYLYDLAVLFMRFYEACPIMKTQDSKQQTSRLALAALTSEILRVSLDLLGIAVVERM